MTTIITESKPARHGKQLNGKRVIITNKLDRKWSDHGVYSYRNKTFFSIIDGSSERRYSCDKWIVEEIIEREE